MPWGKKGREMDGNDEEAKQYRERAEQLIVIAESVTDQKSKDFLLSVAMDYLRKASLREAARAKSERE
jgi:hypothetical protein